MEIKSRDRSRISKLLADQNLKKDASRSTSQAKAKAAEPFRQIQQERLDYDRYIKKKGMVGELSKIFLDGKMDNNPSDDDEAEDDEEGEEEEDDEEDEEEEDDEEGKGDEDTEDRFERMKKEYRKKQEKKEEMREEKEKSKKKKKEKRRKERHEEEEEGEVSSIRSERSDFAPQRREVQGVNVPIAQANASKHDSRIIFEKFPDKDAKLDVAPAASLSPVANGNGKGSETPRNTSGVVGKEKDGASLKRSDSQAGGSKLSGESKSKSILDAKKRDKSNLMEHLARIHAQREEDAKEVYDEIEGESEDNYGIDWQQKLKDLKDGKGRREFRIPGQRMEERLKKRKEREDEKKKKELDKWGISLKPRKQKHLKAKQLYNFKNRMDVEENRMSLQGVNIDLLHTDELMLYYKELISKGNRDLTEHQRLQNEIKKLEYQNFICSKNSPKKKHRSSSKKRSVSKSRSRRSASGSASKNVFKSSSSSIDKRRLDGEAKKSREEKKKKKEKSKEMLGRKTIAY